MWGTPTISWPEPKVFSRSISCFGYCEIAWKSLTNRPQDRFFSKIKKAIKGRDFLTRADLIRIIVDAMPAVDMEWLHSGAQWQWEDVRAQAGVEFRKLRNIHHIEFYRTEGQGVPIDIKLESYN